jgi:hypothetical protein
MESSRPTIYCVVPDALAANLYDTLVDYYRDDTNVEVIVDRRSKGRRKERDRRGEPRADGVPTDEEHLPRRVIRDRRNRRAPGSFPPLRGD